MSRFRGDSWFCSGKTASLGKACLVIKEDCVQEAVFRTFCCVHSWTPPCFWQKWRSQIKMRGFIFITLQGYDVCSSGFPVSSLLKEKSGKPNSLAMTNQKCMKFHMFSFMRIPVPACVGVRTPNKIRIFSQISRPCFPTAGQALTNRSLMIRCFCSRHLRHKRSIKKQVLICGMRCHTRSSHQIG